MKTRKRRRLNLQERPSSLNRRKTRGPARWRPLLVEMLEDRRVLAINVSLAGSVVSFTGDGDGDFLRVQVNGARELEFSANLAPFTNDLDPAPGTQAVNIDTQFVRIHVNLGDGSDELDLRNSGAGGFLGSAADLEVAYDGGRGNNFLRVLDGSASSAQYLVGSGTGQGALSTAGSGGRLQSVTFQNLTDAIGFMAPVDYEVSSGVLQLTANGADNAITYSEDPIFLGRGLVTVDGFPSIDFLNQAQLQINGQGGSDTITLNNPNTPAGLTGITINGGDGSDTLNHTAAGLNSATTINLATSTIASDMANPVTFAGIERINSTGSTTLDIVGTAGPDSFDFAPTGPFDGTVVQQGADLAIQFSGLNGGFTVDPAGGSDVVTVNGTQAGETIDVSGSSVSVDGLKTINLANAEALRVFGQAGDDTFNVTPAASTSIFIDGGDPIGTTAGDSLNVLGGPATFEAGPENDEGGFVTPGSQRVSFDHIEAIGPMVGAPCAIVLGTNGDDDITIIARDAAYDLLADGVRDFTVSVNGGPEVLYLDVAQLYIEGLSGDDDIVLRTPAPNSATWDVDVFIAGGPPAAVTGDQGDVFELETPGFQDVVYSPTGIDSGTINITTLSALITLGAFTNACPSTPQATDGYNSSPGGVEQIVYQGLDADTLTINGNAADDSFVVKPSEGSGSHRSSLAPTFDFSGGATFTVNGGAGGFDTLTLLGTPGPDTVTSSTSSVTLGGTVNLGTGIDRLELYTFAGNDNVVLNLPGTALISRLVDAGEGNDSVTLGAGGSFGADIYGGSGDDSIIGSPGIDNIYGGPGNDVLIGGGAGDNLYGEDGDDLFGNALPTGDGVANDAGNDRFFGGEGSDTLVWDPGDGSDLFEGDEGVDVLRFNGSAAAENFTFNAVSGRLQLLRDVGAISMDLGGVEEVDLSLLGGVDSATVNDLFGTDVRVVNVNLGQDGAADTITVQGRTSADNLTADIAGATVTVTGLAYNINVTGSEVANDSLVINGNDGDDALLAAGAVASAIRPTLSGGAGNDTLIGSLGNETLDGGAGNDLFIGNGGTITVIGGAGNDAIVLPGSPGDDPFVLNMASGGTFLQATVLGVTTTYPTIPTASIEQIVASGGSGNDALSVNESGGAVPIPISFDGGAGFDSISLSGAPATSDTYSVGPDFGSGTSRLVISSVTQTINFSNMEPVFDTVAGPLVVNATNADNSIDYTQGSTTATGLVSIDAYEAIDFSNKTTLMINALGGSDTIHINNPNTPAGLTAITVIGGDPIGSDTLIVAGTSASNTLGITPTSFDAATITGVGPTITVTTIERLRYEGRGGSDTVNYATPSGVHHNIYEPSLVPDAATITSRNIGSGASLVPFEFADLGGDGSLTVSSGDPAASDSLELRGTALDDVFTVSTGGQLRILKPDGGTSPFRTIAINTVNIDELTLQGLDGDDTFDIPASQPFTAIFVGGGDPSASDVLDFTASGADIGVSLSDLTVGEVGNEEVHFSGIETLNVAAGAGAITVMGRASGETLGVRPAGINTARIQPSDLNLVVNTNNTGTLTIDSAAGNDTVTVAGTGNSDFITLIAGGADTTVQEGILKTVTLPTATTEALVINGAEGDDSLTVDVTGIDRVAIPLTFNGGSGEDRLTVTGTPAATIGSVTYTPGGGNEEGRLLYEGAAAPLLVIDFTDLEPIVDLVPAAVLAVNATSADNAINYTQGSSETTGLVSIDGFETIEFSNKTTLVLSGQAGSDLINLNNAATPTGLTGITVSGGDPSGSDTLIVTGTAGTDTLTVAPTSFDSATITGIGPTITASTIEHLRYEGRGGTDVLTYTTPSGDQNNIYEPGLAPDSASITSRSFSGGISLVPFQFVDLGANAVVTIAGGGGLSDHLELRGTPFQDLFTMSTAGQLRILKPVINGTEFRTIAINTSGVSVVTLQGMEGDDTFNVPGSQPYTTVFVDGGDPSASDVINFTATGPAVTVDLAGLRVGHTGDEEINFVGIEVLNVASAVGAITIAGRPTGESFDVTPTGGNTSRIVPGDLNLTINTDNTAGLTIDGAGGSDVLTVHGTEGSDTITVTAAAVTVNALKPIGYLNTEALRVFGRAGDDTFNVTAAANTTIFIDGGDPIGTTPGDRLNILGGPHTFEPGPESDEGGFVFAGAQRISFDHIEAIGPIVGSPCVIILGSQGDDDITVIARDASFDPLADGVQDFTVWVNGGPAILYINTPLLYIDGLAGDDDIVLRTPAPIVAVWAVNVFIAGGPPAAMTGDQGDVFELETPGTQTVNYTPTGSDSGTINLVTLSSLITLGAFTNACPSTPEANDGYNSSPGGVEQFVYDGGGGSDAFTITGTSGNDTIVHTPGGANDEGSLRVNNLLPVAYKTLSSAAVLRVDGSGGTESFVVYGTDANDALTVAASGAVALNSRLALNQTSVENLTLEGLSGDDTFNIPSGHPYAQLNIAGGNPSASDVLAVGGVANVAETITIARDAANPTRQIITGLGGQINVSGVELIRTSDAATPPLDNLTINITGDYHALVTKGDGLNDIVQLDAMPAIVYTNINTLRVVNPSGQDGENHVRFNTTALIGALTYQTSLGFRDTLIIDGTDSAGDLFTVTKPASGSVTVAHTTGGNGTRVTDTGTSLGRLEINGQAGNDSVVVNVAGTAPISVPMTVNGGGGADSLTIQGTPTTAIAGVTYTPGGNVEDGSLLYSDAAGARLMSINFTDLEPVVDLAPAATLTVNGINADNAINYTQGGVAANGLVSIDGFESIEFSNKTTLVLNGLGGSDTVNLNNANTPTGLTGITVNGGDPTESDTLIVTGTTGTDVLTVAPSSFDAVTITGIGPTITAATIEHLRYEGRGGTDALTFQTPSGAHHNIFEPGLIFDSGTITSRGFAPGTSLLPFEFADLGADGPLTFADAGGARSDGLELRGTAFDDLFTVSASGQARVFKPDPTTRRTPPINTPGIANLTLQGLEGDDTFNAPGNHPFALFIVEGGDPSASDVLNFTGSGPAVTVGLVVPNLSQAGSSAISFSGIEVVNVSAGAGSILIGGRTTAESIDVTPTGATTAQIQPADLNFVVNTDNTGLLLLDPVGGSDLVAIHGTSASDAITTARNGTNTTAQVATLKTVTLISANTEALVIAGAEGDDTLTVNVAGTDLLAVPLTFDGGAGRDLLVVSGDPTVTVNSVSYSPGPSVGAGRLAYDSTGTDMVLDFVGLEPVVDLVPAAMLVVNATSADNAINYVRGSVAANGLVSVDNLETIEFSNKATLTINALAGSDTINLNNPETPTGLTGITIEGGDPTTSDMLIANGKPLLLDKFNYMPVGQDSGSIIALGSPTVNFDGIEHVKINAYGDGELTYTTSDPSGLAYIPGSSPDSATVTGHTIGGTSLPPLEFFGLGGGNEFFFASFSNDRTNTLDFYGTNDSDQFSIDGSGSGRLELVRQGGGRVTFYVHTAGIRLLLLRGLDGDDLYNVDGTAPWVDGLVLDGGNPSASDVVNLSGATGPATVQLADPSIIVIPPIQTTVTGYGGEVTLLGIEKANLALSGNNLTVVGTSQDDTITYTPSGPAAGNFEAADLNTVFHFTQAAGAAANAFVIDGGPGVANTVSVNGTAGRDLFSINEIARTAAVTPVVATWQPVTLAANIQVLNARGLTGQDTFLVTPAAGTQFAANPPFFPIGNIDNLLVNVDGGSGSGENNALVIATPAGATLAANQFVVLNRGADGTSGTARTFTAGVQWPDINYVHVQVVSPKVATTTFNGQTGPNLLTIGPDLNEPNETQFAAAFLGADSTLQVQHGAIFPSANEFPFVPSDQDFYRVVAQVTGTLDVQVYFHLFNPALLPAGGNLDVQAFDAAGHRIADAAVTGGIDSNTGSAGPPVFGSLGTSGTARVRFPAVAGQSFFFRVVGYSPGPAGSATTAAQVVNGYDVTVINTPPPVPYDLELDDLPVNPLYVCPQVNPAAANSDTGRSQFDNFTCDATPTIRFRLDDAIFFQDLPGNPVNGLPPGGVIPIGYSLELGGVTFPGFRVAVFDEGQPQQGGALPQVPLGFATPIAPGVYEFTTPTLTDGSHFLTARVQMVDPATPQQTGLGDHSQSLEIVADTQPPPVFLGLPNVPDDGLLPGSDTGVNANPHTLSDRVTSDTTPGFFGQAEADSVIRLFIDFPVNPDGSGDGIFEPSTDFQVGFDVAKPYDGTNQYPSGYWQVDAINFNLNAAPFPIGGPRTIFVTAEDVAGNINPASDVIRLDVFIDTSGPQVTDVDINSVTSTYDLFDPKPSTEGPTPPVNSLVISFRDLPPRTAAFLVEALKQDVAASPGLYQLRGDANGIIPIQQVIVTNLPPQVGQPALATVELVFRLPGPDGIFNTPDDIGAPLPDDRFALTVDGDIIDLTGNHLDGESNATQPLESPSFPSGDKLPGGDFVARFTIDSRPEIGNYSAGSAFIDINGNYFIDPQGDAADYTNRDLVFQIGTISDALFAGKFEPASMAQNDNDGFDKLGAYGYDNSAKKYRFLLDFDHDGVSDLRIVSAFQVNAIPVAGNFAPNHPGDEIGLFDGQNWYLDTLGDNQLHVKIASDMGGQPIVGDFNGDGRDDLATYDAAKNKFFFDTNRDGRADDSLQLNGPFNGYTDLPFAGDMNLDGIDDLGIWVPNRQGSPTANISEWYFIVSDRVGQSLPHNVFDHYAPTPLGNDLFAQFGDHFSLPIFGNFDPPVSATSASSQTNSLNPLDVNNDGSVSPIDALLIINQINAGTRQQRSAAVATPPFLDVNADKSVSAIDALMVINYLNSQAAKIGSEAEGESADAILAAADRSSADVLREDLLAILAAETATVRPRVLRAF